MVYQSKDMKKLLWLIPAAILALTVFTFNAKIKTSSPLANDGTSLKKPLQDPEIKAMRRAMLKFRNSLSAELLSKASSSLDSERLYLWHNTPIPVRGADTKIDGIMYGDLSDVQLSNFKEVLKLFLSKQGYQKVNEITVLAEGFLHEVRPQVWDTKLYSIDLFGNPEKDNSWGFQLEGHHCVINFLVHDDNVSMVPAFLGAEPVTGSYKGKEYDIFADERDLALQLYHSLNQQELNAFGSIGEVTGLTLGAGAAGEPDPYRGDYDYSQFKKGLKHTSMNREAKELLKTLMQEHVNNLASTFANRWWQDIEDNLDDTYFVWIDQVDTPDKTSQFYYRIYNPYLWIEFNVNPPIFKELEDWNHVHSITRIPNNPATNYGGDYGIFANIVNQNRVKTLYQHYAMADHHKASKLNLDYTIEQIPGHPEQH
jgi:hypothetical protein